jgi:hypothetical protein
LPEGFKCLNPGIEAEYATPGTIIKLEYGKVVSVKQPDGKKK